MKKALLLFGTLSLALFTQSCTSDNDEIVPVKQSLSTFQTTDTIATPNTTSKTYDNGDLGKDLDKKK